MKIDDLVKSSHHMILYIGDGNFKRMMLAAVKGCGNQVVIWNDNLGGGEKEYKPFEYPRDHFEQWTVIVCMDNVIYAEEAKERLAAAGYSKIYLPADLGAAYTTDKLDAIEFNLNIGCSLNCHYCPQNVLLKAYQKYGKESSKRHLTFDDFKFIVDNRINPGATVSFSGMSEPFENKDFIKMLLYAGKKGNKILLNTTLMGLNEEYMSQIVSSGIHIEQIMLHIPDNKGNSHFKITSEYIKVLQMFLKYYHNNIMHLSCHGTAPDQAVTDIVKNAEVKKIVYEEWLGSRCGNLNEEIRQAPNKKGRLVCALPSASIPCPVCMPDGTLALCCNDYALDTCIGNILDDTWGQIALGEGWQRYLRSLDDENIEYICRHCITAGKKDDVVKSLFPDYYYYGNNFYRIHALAMENGHPLLQKLRKADHICIFGLGKFFKDNYFYAGWSEIIHADLFSDNNEDLWGRRFGDIPIIPKHELLSYDNLVVIVYVNKPDKIIFELQRIGIKDIMTIRDIMQIFE
ncbi:MAG: radical SAM protein [Eubacterium sp.]|nr:radical SAM protein [Eubacterium sp.]